MQEPIPLGIFFPIFFFFYHSKYYNIKVWDVDVFIVQLWEI